MNSLTLALLGPIFLMLTFGAMESGRIMFSWLVITNESREAARYGAVRYGRTTDTGILTGEIRRYVDTRVGGMLPRAGIARAPDVIVTHGEAPTVDVTLYYQVPLVIPAIGRVLPNPFPLAARSVMRGEPGG